MGVFVSVRKKSEIEMKLEYNQHQLTLTNEKINTLENNVRILNDKNEKLTREVSHLIQKNQALDVKLTNCGNLLGNHDIINELHE